MCRGEDEGEGRSSGKKMQTTHQKMMIQVSVTVSKYVRISTVGSRGGQVWDGLVTYCTVQYILET